MKQPKWLQRIVECYDKKTEELVCEYPLGEVDLQNLQEKWNQPSNQPMVAVFDVNKEQSIFLNTISPELKFDFNKYDYQISSISTDFELAKSEGGFMGEIPPPGILPAFPHIKRIKSK
jgi:hypothetical protein